MHTNRSIFPTLLLALALSSCVSGPAMRVATAPVREVIEESRPLILAAPSTYGTPVALEESQAARVTRFKTGLAAGVASTATHDPALDKVAAVFAQTVGVTGQAPADAVVDWLCWRFGALGLVKQTLTQVSSGYGAAESLEGAVVGEAAKISPADMPLGYGLAIVEHGPNRAVLTVVVAHRPVTVSPVAKVQEAGAKVTLSGKAMIPARAGRVVVDTGKIPREIDISFDKDGAFSVDVPLPTEPGRWFVELVAEDARQKAREGEGWSESFLLLPFYVGVDEPNDPEAAIRTPVPNPPTRAEWPDAMLKLLNDARVAAGAGPVERMPLLDELIEDDARAHVQDPDRPPDHDHQETLALKGFPASKLDVHMGSLEFVDEATRRLLQSPRNRRSFLDPARTRIGITFQGTFNGATPFGALLFTPATQAPMEVSSTAFFKAVNAARLKRMKLPVIEDAELRDGATTLAKRVCSGELDAQTLDVGRLLKLKRPFEDAQARSFIAVHMEPGDSDEALGELLDGVWTHAAVASCRGKVARYPDGQFVLFLFLR